MMADARYRRAPDGSLYKIINRGGRRSEGLSLLFVQPPSLFVRSAGGTESERMPALRTRATHPPARPLNLSTPPLLTVVAPTPRVSTFSFPTKHNLADSPFSSPSSSPFEPDLRDVAEDAEAAERLASSAASPQAPHHDALPPPPTKPAPRRASSTEPCRPKRGDPNYVKRPENAFMLFRRECAAELRMSACPRITASSSSAPVPDSTPKNDNGPSPQAPSAKGKSKMRQADLSKMISARWKALSPAERARWQDLAAERKHEHGLLHPEYVFRPARPLHRRTSRKSSTPVPQALEFIVPASSEGRRSASTPAHPHPYQLVQVPRVDFSLSNSSSSFSASLEPSPDFFSFSDPFTDFTALSPSLDPNSSLLSLLSMHGMGGDFDYIPRVASTGAGAPQLAEGIQEDASAKACSLRGALLPETIASPASSADGSSQSSPYTPASALHSFLFYPPVHTSHPYPSSFRSVSAASAKLDIPSTTFDPRATFSHPFGDAEASYAPWAPQWAAASPWSSTSFPLHPGDLQLDFDIGHVPASEAGWGVDAFSLSEAQSGVPEFHSDSSPHTPIVFPGASSLPPFSAFSPADGVSMELDLDFPTDGRGI
ncbi:hypothetical protein B0H15DRAFT_869174 [Mycena belliarum]|uniref:HMG box domain-containing protein n=1 Tax=Mycena belliarum TaxID=1033014 RepID=A0AAD6XLR8_9AGAR|nr:hypothetical protein B0H15DRAFT_869174 [Mycena belliae]